MSKPSPCETPTTYQLQSGTYFRINGVGAPTFRRSIFTGKGPPILHTTKTTMYEWHHFPLNSAANSEQVACINAMPELIAQMKKAYEKNMPDNRRAFENIDKMIGTA